MSTMVLGLDLSLRSSGLVAVPQDWALEWGRCAVGRAGEPLSRDASEELRVARLVNACEAVRSFARTYNCSHAVIEQYAFNAPSQSHALGELGGAVKYVLARSGLAICVVSPARARRLLGKAPRLAAKAWAAQRLVTAGAPKSWSLDQMDAFCVANWLLSELGGDAIVLPEAVC